MHRFRAGLAVSGRLVLAAIFWGAVRLFFSVEVRGLEYATVKQTYFAMAHKRDLDPLVEVPSVLFHRGWKALAGEVRFALRGDAFFPGFLGRIVRRPRWLALLLRPLRLGPLLRALGVYPLESLHWRPAEQWIRDWLRIGDDLPVGEVLTSAFVQRLAMVSREDEQALLARPLSHLLAWRYQSYLQDVCKVDMFSERHRVRKEILRQLQRQLGELAGWTMQGGSVWGAPEGQLSADGRLGHVASVLYRLLQAGPPEQDVVPISITYDFMVGWHPRIFVNLAAPLRNARRLPARQLALDVRDAWLLNSCFTCTHLASDFLVRMQHRAPFTLDALVVDIRQQAGRLLDEGRRVDRRLLSPGKAKSLARRYLEFALRSGLVCRAGRHCWQSSIGSIEVQSAPGEVGYARMPLAYALNELREMLTVSVGQVVSPV